MGGIRSVIWSDLIQLIVHAGAALAVIIYLLVRFQQILADHARLENQGQIKLKAYLTRPALISRQPGPLVSGSVLASCYEYRCIWPRPRYDSACFNL